ncbi:iron complex transport system ATP-binding protein [Paracoccus aminovorans]|uniref:Iron complex transport system ATP-binding protein n=1 Tax=Paracoccus aminovorans TaxID=34004 RepID=A0A1I3APM5_9RHOB|nr:ABC transporter ATP-binding protein [Paracoccus aminovorans]CQR84310.1 histidinol-phosphatase [Paracoccus aminovorans]SFH52004.1 iron complex transport system ATP-binding protein [Paracoccus aminovorans]
MSILAENLVWRIGQKTVVDDVSLAVEPGMVLGLLGPNGSGKSSLLRLLAGLRRPVSGRVMLDGRDIARTPRRDLARRVALVQQHASTEINVSVEEVVRLGRTPHRSALSGWTRADQQAVDMALDQVGMTGFRRESWHGLSGGERQRVHIARALAQEPRELFLDEPTNHLDIQHQLELLRLIPKLGLTSIVALHDLNHAAMFCDRLLVLDRGRVIRHGTPAEVLTPDLLRDVFRVECDFLQQEQGFHILFRR